MKKRKTKKPVNKWKREAAEYKAAAETWMGAYLELAATSQKLLKLMKGKDK